MNVKRGRAVWIYTSDSDVYRELNKALRAKDRGLLIRVFFPFLRLLLTAFQCLPKVFFKLRI